MDKKEMILKEVVNKIKGIHVYNSSYINAHDDLINAIICVFLEFNIDLKTVRVQHDVEEYNLIVISSHDGYKKFFIEIEVETDAEVMATDYKVIEARLKNIIYEINFDELNGFYKTEGDVIRFLEKFICVSKYPQLAMFTNWTKRMKGIIHQLWENEMLEIGCQVTYKLNSCETDSGADEVIDCGRLIKLSERVDYNCDFKGYFLLSYE